MCIESTEVTKERLNPVDLEAVREYLHKDQQNDKDGLEGRSKW